MIEYSWDNNDLAYVQKKLGDLKGEANRVLRDAVNKTAVSARKQLMQVAQKRYTVKAGGFNSRATIQKGTIADPTATIKIKGRTLTMPRYRITKPKSGVKAEIIKGSGLKTVESSNRIKAFIATVGTSTLVMQRKGKARYPLRAMRSPSVPKQLEMVYDGKKITSTPLKKEIQKMYKKYVDQQIERVLKS